MSIVEKRRKMTQFHFLPTGDAAKRQNRAEQPEKGPDEPDHRSLSPGANPGSIVWMPEIAHLKPSGGLLLENNLFMSQKSI